MGTCHISGEIDSAVRLSRSDFEYIKAIGRGALGLVWRVVHKKTRTELAIKEIEKNSISSKEALLSVLNERSLLSILNHPFIININFAFQDKKKLYLGLDLKLGGDLRYHMIKRKRTESEMKFIIACILQGLEYLHSRHIIHKDIKPENIIYDDKGYVFITDFGTSTIWKEENYSETSGTPGYMAPEVICRQNYSFTSDYFALGVILYENIIGTRPYQGRNRKEIREAILEKQAKIIPSDIPVDWSIEAVSFCNKLLKRKPNTRLGANGINELKSHPWLNEISEKMLQNFELKAPFIPSDNDNFDHDHVNFYSKCERHQAKTTKHDFLGYSFIPSPASNRKIN
ncbi:hypothetical protein SteCoe_32495 [Stentor coeruleus]|uniref:non-specific serine/threonine protein kinase n=1 Tax=Stentor coeruleus TaxID=5963 RepID=A0A1R2AYZ1_9CILI|nr:hypothetical protein SteCoe_32495 [Stentor coeruleus]